MQNPYQQFFKQARKSSPSQAKKLNIKKLQNDSAQGLKAHVNAMKHDMKSKRTNRMKKRFPVSAGIALLVSLLVAVYLSYDLERVETWLNSIEVGILGAAEASGDKASPKEEKKDQTKEQKAEKTAEAENKDEAKPKSPTTQMTAEELTLFKSLEERRQALDQRERELKSLEEELQKQKEALDKRLVDIEQVRKSIATQLEEKVKVDQERVEQLVQFYSTMKPQQAAKIVESLNEDLAVEVLLKMKKKNAADIMNLIDAQKAQKLSEKFAGYRKK